MSQLSATEKEKIILEIPISGLSVVSRKYGISRTVLDRWNNRYKDHGLSGLYRKQPQQTFTDAEKERLENENSYLKTMLAEKELELRIKNDLLKKSLLRSQKSEK